MRASSLLPGLAMLVAMACAATPEFTVTGLLMPPQDQFVQNVSPFFEKRCGSLDCHGQYGRPLRIYSNKGLRLRNDGGLLPGVGNTTDEEKVENYRNVISLEPEITRRVISGELPARALLLLQKPLAVGNDVLKAHKGGKVLTDQGDDGERCVTSWLGGTVDANACAAAAAAFEAD